MGSVGIIIQTLVWRRFTEGLPQLVPCYLHPRRSDNIAGAGKCHAVVYVAEWPSQALRAETPPAAAYFEFRTHPICSTMSAIGTKRTSQVAPHMSAIGGKADMVFCAAHVCL